MSTAVVANWKYSRLAPPPPWRDQATLEGLFARLSSPQLLAMDRLMAQDGNSCDVPLTPLYALLRRELLVEVVSLDANGWRCCPWCRPTHRWYHILPDVETAYTAWSRQWDGSGNSC